MQDSNDYRLELFTNVSNLQTLGDYWDDKLSKRKGHLFPLAPVDMDEMGMITPANYAIENESFGRFCTSNMSAELKLLVGDSELRKSISRPKIEIFGPGLARDLDWVAEAIGSGFTLNVRDVSSVACEHVTDRFRRFVSEKRVEFVIGEIEKLWKWQEKSGDTLAFYASQFIQVQKKEKMQRILSHLGSLLDVPPGLPKRWLYMVHPFGVDNKGSRVWERAVLPSVAWGDTTPYNECTLVRALQRGSKRKVILSVLGKKHYYHQTYSFCRVTVE